MTSGVPQGSVLARRYSCSTSTISQVSSTAGSKSLQMTASSTKRSDIQMMPPLCSQTWTTRFAGGDEWKLTFIASKCKVLHIGRTSSQQDYRLRGTPMEAVAEEKDLGVFVDAQLNFRKQAAAAVNKASQVVPVIKRSFSLLTTQLCLFSTSRWCDHTWSMGTSFGGRLTGRTSFSLSGSSAERRSWCK